MSRNVLFVVLSFFSSAGVCQQTTFYQYSVDLTSVKEDKIKVELTTPKSDRSELIFRFPKTVPGTYSIDNYGRFIEDLKCFDLEGKEIKTIKLDENSWKISPASNLEKITYWVNDTYDAPQKKEFVFEPAGSNIEENKNFVLNTHCVFGYLDGLNDLPYIVNFNKPEGFYGSTSLQTVKSSLTSDTYMVPNYMELVDAPIMYNIPDTTTLKVGGADILVSVYSPEKVLSSKFVSENIKDILLAAEKYFGGNLPVKKYAFIIYLFNKQSGSGSYGALEHSYSSMYYLPEVNPELLAQTIKDIAAHEFFHILTPLNIHSEEIHNFNFNDPKMSKHLWLYEGVTEYTAGQVQVRAGMIDPETYLETMIRDKMFDAERFDDNLPFTELSEFSLDEHKDQYQNVYEKGALIAMGLDITLRDFSEGKYGLKNLISDLSKEYGKDKPFKDDELFDKIVTLTYPEVKLFLEKYISGPASLPYDSLFKKVGVIYSEESKFRYFTLGDIGLSYDEENQHFVIADVSEMNEIGKKLAFKKNDKLLQINRKKVTLENLEEFYSGTNPFKFRENKKMKIIVLRQNDAGNDKKVKLKAKAKKIEYEQKHRLEFIDDATPRQMLIRKSWLGQ